MSVMTKDMMEKDATNPMTALFTTWPKIMENFKEYLEEDRRACRDIIKRLDGGEEKISAIFISIHFGYVCTEILTHYQVPIVAISPPGLVPHLAGVFGNPDNPAYSPDLFLPMVAPLTFTERLTSTLVYLLVDGRYNPLTTWALEKAGLDIGNWEEILRNRVDLLLLASHHVTHSPSVLAPNTLEI